MFNDVTFTNSDRNFQNFSFLSLIFLPFSTMLKCIEKLVEKLWEDRELFQVKGLPAFENSSTAKYSKHTLLFKEQNFKPSP